MNSPNDKSAQTCRKNAHVVIKRSVGHPPRHQRVADRLRIKFTHRTGLVSKRCHNLIETLATGFDESIAVEHNRRSGPEQLGVDW